MVYYLNLIVIFSFSRGKGKSKFHFLILYDIKKLSCVWSKWETTRKTVMCGLLIRLNRYTETSNMNTTCNFL